ncbi:MAG: response regulator transcription factor [Rhodospirillales bacterium]|jgi:two-component system nitrate/nitrite response regulator NarP|nr:DNA-binding response regulator [Rhodospirillaceae bacterium]MDP6428159.1 response regulator transcription factor [Rhodospirillales bacterium]MDP6642958.1 response regulator transcription factor [Rhodospirillales bacterium]MDP6840713.1 response regulator transcription factor [Rhodospirillales bacterium]|tara:strand:- start:1009 stop:1638 length:630 start_codon:yes stop_codon:yes gene_type:complete
MAKQPSSPDQPPLQVAIADKSPLIQAALNHLISEDPRFQLQAVCGDGEELLEIIEATDLDVVVTGWVMPPGDGRYVLDHLKATESAPRVVVYTGAEGEMVPSLVMAHGGAAFVSKSEQPHYLLDTIADVGQGKMVFPFLDVKRIHDNPLTGLTNRELEVLSSLAAGRTNKEIARELGVSANTVKYHVRNLYQKLRVKNRGQAIGLYLKS